MYVLQGAKCGSVRFKPFVNGVINKETVSRQSTITGRRPDLYRAEPNQ